MNLVVSTQKISILRCSIEKLGIIKLKIICNNNNILMYFIY